MAKSRPRTIIGLLIHLVRLLISKKIGPIWVRVVLALLLGILLAMQVVCGGLSLT